MDVSDGSWWSRLKARNRPKSERRSSVAASAARAGFDSANKEMGLKGDIYEKESIAVETK